MKKVLILGGGFAGVFAQDLVEVVDMYGQPLRIIGRGAQAEFLVG